MPACDEGMSTMKMLVWVLFAVIAAVWTGGAWLTASALQWAAQALAGGQAVDWAAAMGSWSLPTWLVVGLDLGWLQSVQVFVVELIEGLHGAWPAFGQAVGWLVPVVWVVWALGLAMLLLLAGLGHWLAARSGRPAAPLPRAA